MRRSASSTASSSTRSLSNGGNKGAVCGRAHHLGALACVNAAGEATAGVWPRPADTEAHRNGRQVDELRGSRRSAARRCASETAGREPGGRRAARTAQLAQRQRGQLAVALAGVSLRLGNTPAASVDVEPSAIGGRDRALWATAFYAGLRLGELQVRKRFGPLAAQVGQVAVPIRAEGTISRVAVFSAPMAEIQDNVALQTTARAFTPQIARLRATTPPP